MGNVESGPQQQRSSASPPLPQPEMAQGPSSSRDRDVFAAIDGGAERLGLFVAAAGAGGAELSRTRNAEGDTPLAAAIRRNDARTVQILLEAQVSTNSAGLRKPFLSLAAEQRNAEIVRLLLDYGAMPYMTDSRGHSPLHAAAAVGDAQCFDLILRRCDREQIEGKTQDRGETPLHIAVRNGHIGVVNQLIARAAPLHVIELSSGSTPLHIACRKGDSAMVRTLAEAGAPLNVTDFDGNTLLHDAARGASFSNIRFLASRGSIFRARNCDGNTVIHVAVLSKMGVPQLVDLAKMQPADLVICNRSGMTPPAMARDVYPAAYEALLAAFPRPESPQTSLDTQNQKQKEWSLHFTSDIHLEFGRPPDIKGEARFVALLGDTGLLIERNGVDHIQRYRNLLHSLSSRYQRVFVILGNHEFYHNEYEASIKTLEGLAKERPNIEFLHRRSVVVAGVRVVGTTLWSRIPEQHHQVVPLFFNDFKLITKGKTPITPADTTAWHEEDRKFIASEIAAATEAGQKVVVLSHHAPLWNCGTGPAEAYYDPITHATASDMSDLMGGNVVAWLYGHTHWYQDITVKGTRVASNPHGYPQDGITYDPRFTVSFPVAD